MINNTGPDKGLLDMVFGSKKEAAQAKVPAAAGAEGKDGAVKQVPEDFMAMLAKKAQDQKDAAAAEAVLQTKDGSKLATKSAGATDAAKKEAAAKLAKQNAKAGVIGALGKKGAKETAADEVQKAKAKAAGAQVTDAAEAAGVLQAQVKSEADVAALQGAAGPKTMPAMTAAQAQQLQQLHQQTQLQATQAAAAQGAAVQTAAARAAASTAGGVPGAGAGQQAVVAAQQAAVAAQQAAVTAQQAAQMVMQQGIAQSQAAQATAQPIVIQMPMAIPVQILEMDEGDLEQLDTGSMHMDSAVGGSKPQLTSSQDFLAQMGIKQGGVLGVDRMDPRLGRYNDERQESGGKSNDGNLAMMMPQLGTQQSRYSDTTTAMPVSGAVQVTAGHDGKPVLANTMGLANEVATLAARGGGEVRVRIVPENLGEMTISVKTEGQHLNVQIETASSAARDAVASAMPELRQMLTASHYKVGSLEVNHAAAGSQVMMSQAGDGVGMSQWSNQSSFSDWQGGGRQDDQGGSAWDRYQAQHEARQEAKQQQQYRQQSGYRRYQQEQLEA